MFAKEPAPKKSTSSPKNGTKRGRAARESRAAQASKPSAGPRKSTPPATALDAAASLAERVEAERERIFKALSIVECCRFATATLLEVGDTEYMIPAFETVCDLLSDAAEELEGITSACEKAASTGRR